MPVYEPRGGVPDNYVQAYLDDNPPFQFPVPDVGRQFGDVISHPRYGPTDSDILAPAVPAFLAPLIASAVAVVYDLPWFLLIGVAGWLLSCLRLLLLWWSYIRDFPDDCPSALDYLIIVRSRSRFFAAVMRGEPVMRSSGVEVDPQ